MRRRIDCERQAMFGRRSPQLVTDDTRLNPGRLLAGADADDPVHVLGEVEHHAGIHALPGESRAAPAAEHRSIMSPADLQSCKHVRGMAGDDDA